MQCLLSQVQGNKYPVVSVPSGASSAKKYIKRELEWLSKFENIVIDLIMMKQEKGFSRMLQISYQ